MSQLHERPDGVVYVRTPSGTYSDTAQNFLLDFRWQMPAKPARVAERLYDDSGTHMLIDDKGNHVATGPIPWDLGDKAIAMISTLLERQKARQAVPPPPAPEPPPQVARAPSRMAGRTANAVGATVF